MSSRTLIIVLHMKEVIYTTIFLILAIILAVVIFFMFGPGKSTASSNQTHKYKPGVYNSSITLNDNTFDVEVTVNADEIRSIQLVNLSESTQAMFPLMEPVLESLAGQIYSSQSLDDLKYDSDRKYTSQVLLAAIKEAVKKAENS